MTTKKERFRSRNGEGRQKGESKEWEGKKGVE